MVKGKGHVGLFEGNPPNYSSIGREALYQKPSQLVADHCSEKLQWKATGLQNGCYQKYLSQNQTISANIFAIM